MGYGDLVGVVSPERGPGHAVYLYNKLCGGPAGPIFDEVAGGEECWGQGFLHKVLCTLSCRGSLLCFCFALRAVIQEGVACELACELTW